MNSDGEAFLVAGTRSLLILQWNLTTMEKVHSWKAHQAPVLSLSIDKKYGRFVATASADSSIRVWDLQEKFCTHYFTGHRGVVSFVKLVEDSDGEMKCISGGGMDGSIRIWDLKRKTCEAVLTGVHTSLIKQVEVSPDYRYLLSIAREQVFCVWSLETKKLVSTVPVNEILECGNFMKDQNGDCNVVLTGGEKGLLRSWDWKKGKMIMEMKETSKEMPKISHVVAASSDLVLYADGNHAIWEVAPDTLAKKSMKLMGNFEEIIDLCLVGKENLAIASSSPDIHLAEIDTKTGSLKKDSIVALSSHSDTIMCLDADSVVGDSVSSETLMVSGSKDESIKVWTINKDGDKTSIKCVGECLGHVGTIQGVKLSKKHDGNGNDSNSLFINRFLVSVAADRTLKRWNLTPYLKKADKKSMFSFSAVFTVTAHEKDINCVEISPKEDMIATGSQDKRVKIWNSSTGEPIAELKGHKRGITSIAFTPGDSTIMATSSGDKTIKLWSLSDFTCAKTFEGHTNSVLQTLFITNGTQILSSGSDGLIKLWKISDSSCIQTIDVHEDRIWALTCIESEQDCTIFSGSADGVVSGFVDKTKETLDKLNAEQERLCLEDAELNNLVLKKDYVQALKLALKLNRRLKMAHILKDAMASKHQTDGSNADDFIFGKEVDEWFSRMNIKELEDLLKFCVEWNSSNSYRYVAQNVLYIILKHYAMNSLANIPNVKEKLDVLLAYTERHFTRFNNLIIDSFMVDYALNELEKL